MFIAIRKQFEPDGEKVVVFNSAYELDHWCGQVGAATMAQYVFRRLGALVTVELTATIEIK